MKKITICFLFFSVFTFFSYSQNSKTIHIEKAGTLNTLISNNEKYSISNLTLTGQINGDDISFIREMCGGTQFEGYTEGILAHINMEDAMIVQGGSYSGRNYETSNFEIGQSMFSLLEKLKTIKLPKTTKVIGATAFLLCKNLEYIEIPDNTFSIYSSAFEECESLTRVSIGKGLSELLQGWHFFFCPKLKSFEVSEDNENYTSIDGILFSKDGSKLIYYPNARSKTYNIPEGIKLGAHSFAGCIGLEQIEIPEGITELQAVFCGCSGLKSIKLPGSLRRMDEAFERCTSLTSVTIPYNVSDIGRSFSGCENLLEIKCLNPIPPRADFVYGVNTIDAKVYVPIGSANAYNKAEGWRNFLHIIEADMETDNSEIANDDIQIYTESNGVHLGNLQKGSILSMYTISGLLVKKITINTENCIGLNLSPGVYIINIQSVEGKNISRKVTIK